MSELSVKDRIKGAKRERRVYKINLRGDLVAEIERLEGDLDKQQDEDRRTGATRAGMLVPVKPDYTEAGVLARRILALREEMNDSWLELTLEHQGWDRWQEFRLTHPAREDAETDKVAGFNFDALVREFMPTCVVEPELDGEDWEQLFAVCAPGDLRDLGGVAFAMHERGLDVPLSRAAFATIARINADSGPLAPGESPSDDSTDGPQQSSTSTTTTETGDSPTPS